MYCNIDILTRKSTKILQTLLMATLTHKSQHVCVFTMCVRLCTLFWVNKAADCIPILQVKTVTEAYANTSQGKDLHHFQ